MRRSCPQLTDRIIPPDDGNPRPTKDAAIQQKSNTIANCLKQNDTVKFPEVPRRRTSLDACQPQLLRSPSPTRHTQPMALPVPRQSGCKSTTSKRPVLGGEGIMPPNLLNELSSVLSKTGRSAKSND